MFMQEIVHHAHKLHEEQVTKPGETTDSTQMQQVPQMAAPVTNQMAAPGQNQPAIDYMAQA